MIVADTNLIAYFFIQGDKTRVAEQVYHQDSDWVVPFLWRSEFRNVLALYLRQNLIALEKANGIMAEAEAYFRGRQYEVASSDVLNLAMLSSCSAYDCEYASLALFLDIPLITFDKKLLAAFPQTAVSPTDFLASRN